MLDIHLYDVYPFLHTAEGVQGELSNRNERNFPVGGLHFFLRKLTAELVRQTKVCCAFDSPFNGKTRLDGYKANRKKNPRVIAQAEYLYNMLRACGIPSYRGFGEADDHIFGMTETFKGSIPPGGFSSLCIYTGDMDLAHNVDPCGVMLCAVNENSYNVHWQNYPIVLRDSKVDEPIRFNTISAYKTLLGDKSDSIKRLATEPGGKSPLELYRAYVKFLDDNNVTNGFVSRDKELFLSYMGDIVDGPVIDEIKKRADTVFPTNLSDKVGGYIIADSSGIDLQLLVDYCAALNCRVGVNNLRKLLVYPYEPKVKELQEEIYQKGLEFKNGSFHADKNIPLENLSTFSSKININKGF